MSACLSCVLAGATCPRWSYSWEAIWAIKVPNSLSYQETKVGKVVLGGDSSSGTICESVDAILKVAGGCPVISDIQDVLWYPSKACLTTSQCHDV